MMLHDAGSPGVINRKKGIAATNETSATDKAEETRMAALQPVLKQQKQKRYSDELSV